MCVKRLKNVILINFTLIHECVKTKSPHSFQKATDLKTLRVYSKIEMNKGFNRLLDEFAKLNNRNPKRCSRFIYAKKLFTNKTEHINRFLF